MRVYFVGTSKGIDEQLMRVDDGSLVIIGHGANIEIDLVRELDGGDDVIKRLSLYSRRRNATIVVGIKAKIYRREYLSVAVIDGGKIMGISDATHDIRMGGKYNLGASYRVYRTRLGAIGIIVGSDILYPEVMRSLSTHDSDYIVELAGGMDNNKAISLLSAESYFNGIMSVGIVNNEAFAINRDGEVLNEGLADNMSLDLVMSRDKTLVNHLRSDIYDNVYIEE